MGTNLRYSRGGDVEVLTMGMVLTLQQRRRCRGINYGY